MNPGPLRIALAAALLAAACASPPTGVPPPGTDRGLPPASADPRGDAPVLDLAGAVPPEPPGPPRPRGLVPGGADPAVASLGGETIPASEVARFLFRFDPARALDALNQILDARVLERDAAARGVSLPPGELEARTEAEVRRQEQEVRVQYGPAVTLEQYLAERFGFTLEAYRRDLASLVRLQALRDRLVRYEALREDRIRIRVLVLPDEAGAREAARRLREGADFAALARQVSLAPPEELPTYAREEIHPPALAEELFAMAPGDVSRPVRVARGGREVFEVFKVVEVLPARDLPWAAVAGDVERGLKSRPVSPAEYLQWARRARERHGVRILLEGAEGGGGR